MFDKRAYKISKSFDSMNFVKKHVLETLSVLANRLY